MSKFVDTDGIVDAISGQLTGESLLPKSSLQTKEAAKEIDLYAEMERRAALYEDKLINDAHKSVELEGLGVKVLNVADRQKEVLRSLSGEGRKKLAGVAAEIRAIADKADTAGLRKQAADLRFVASKLV
jgi:hypothetical protein